jgi:hypothetical protein
MRNLIVMPIVGLIGAIGAMLFSPQNCLQTGVTQVTSAPATFNFSNPCSGACTHNGSIGSCGATYSIPYNRTHCACGGVDGDGDIFEVKAAGCQPYLVGVDVPALEWDCEIVSASCWPWDDCEKVGNTCRCN